MNRKKVLVIGSGACGLTAIKACKEEDLDVTCYERSEAIGGLWRYSDSVKDNVSSVMKSTITNSSKEMSSFSDFPMPSYYPMYLHHKMMLQYLEMYAEKFELLSAIRFNHEIIALSAAEDYASTGRWIVKVRDLFTEEEREEVFDGIMVCSGHHSYPSIPTYKGIDLFSGQILHSHAYRSYEGFKDKSVLVIGAGNSGADIAVELTKVSNKVYLSARRPTWFYPRTVSQGKPIDIMLARRYLAIFKPKYFMEKKLQKWLTNRMDLERFGMKPPHRILEQHPTINDELKNKLLCGAVILKNDVEEFGTSEVRFHGEEEFKEIDAVIFATGYLIKFPFISDDILPVHKANKAYLYKDIFPPQLKHLSLGIMGLIQPFGSLIPVFEIQARWYASLMAGKSRLPNRDDMLADVKKVEEYRAKSFIQSERHATEVLWLSYMDDIASQFGAKPNLFRMFFSDPKLFWACVKGPCLPFQYRLSGPHTWDFAKEFILGYKQRIYNEFCTR